MKILNKESQELKVQKVVERTYPLYIAKLDNGVEITVFGDYAIGDDGKKYYHIGREEDDMLVTVGWSCEVDGSVIVE